MASNRPEALTICQLTQSSVITPLLAANRKPEDEILFTGQHQSITTTTWWGEPNKVPGGEQLYGCFEVFHGPDVPVFVAHRGERIETPFFKAFGFKETKIPGGHLQITIEFHDRDPAVYHTDVLLTHRVVTTFEPSEFEDAAHPNDTRAPIINELIAEDPNRPPDEEE